MLLAFKTLIQKISVKFGSESNSRQRDKSN